MLDAALANPANHSKILLLAIDFDGCIFNENYCKSTNENRLIESNQAFILFVENQIKAKEYDKIRLIVASNRQSKGLDDFNCGTKGSCFPAILKLCEAIQTKTQIVCEVDRYLLADTYGHRPIGENFTKALTNESYSFSETIWDDAKRSLVYCQMNKAASENPEAYIDYCFFDDRKDILSDLEYFYRQHKNFIPDNVVFYGFQYEGQSVNQFQKKSSDKFELSGQGIADNFYQENLIFLANCCGLNTRNVYLNHDKSLSNYWYLDNLRKFENERKKTVYNMIKELEYQIKLLKPKVDYDKDQWQVFIYHLENTLQQIKLNLRNKNLNNAPNTKEIEKDYYLKLLNDTSKMLREYQDYRPESSYYNIEREQHLLKYINYYGQPTNFFLSSLRTFTNQINHLFYQPNALTQSVYQLAEKLKPLILADNLAFHNKNTVNLAYK